MKGRKLMAVLDLPFLDLYPFKKPLYHGLWTRVSRRIFGESLLNRTSFIYNTYISRGFVKLAVFGFGVYAFAYLIMVAPPVHTWRLEKAYEDRHERHLKYLEEDPNYERALLQAYKTLGPQKNA